MEVKNPLFKEDFGQSTTNLHTSESITSMPPSYSAINNTESSGQKAENLVQIVETPKIDGQKATSDTK